MPSWSISSRPMPRSRNHDRFRPQRTMPSDMVALIADYENGLKGRIYAIVNDLVQSNALTGARPPTCASWPGADPCPFRGRG